MQPEPQQTPGDEESKQENAQKAKETADRLFPDEKWEQKTEWSDRIFVSSRRKTSDKSNFKTELMDAKTLCDNGSTVYLVPEIKIIPGKKIFDAIVDGEITEFKNVVGGTNALEKRFIESRFQAPNVFINTEESTLSRRQIIATLAATRNGTKYPMINAYQGGMIILKIKGISRLIHLAIDGL